MVLQLRAVKYLDAHFFRSASAKQFQKSSGQVEDRMSHIQESAAKL